MASENETLDKIIGEARKENGYTTPWFVCFLEDGGVDISELLDRIEASHGREVAELKTAYDRAVSADARHAIENDSLLRRLKVAEDALESAWMYASKLPHQWPLPERVRAKMKNALAAIKKDGGAR